MLNVFYFTIWKADSRTTNQPQLPFTILTSRKEKESYVQVCARELRNRSRSAERRQAIAFVKCDVHHVEDHVSNFAQSEQSILKRTNGFPCRWV